MLEGERVKLNGPRSFAVPPVDLASRQPLAPAPAGQSAIAAVEDEAERLGDAFPATEPE